MTLDEFCRKLSQYQCDNYDRPKMITLSASELEILLSEVFNHSPYGDSSGPVPSLDKPVIVLGVEVYGLSSSGFIVTPLKALEEKAQNDSKELSDQAIVHSFYERIQLGPYQYPIRARKLPTGRFK